MTSSAVHILIVEDEEAISLNIADYFEPKGYVLDFAISGTQGLEMALACPYDVIILDLMLPGMDGYEVCQKFREVSTRHTPILMLTARDTADEMLAGFNSGTDDYLTKPFSLAELEARVVALSRRHLFHRDHILTLGELKIDRRQRQVWRCDTPISLKKISYEIMEALMMAHPAAISRAELIQKIWQDEPTESDALRSHIYQLRNQLDKPYDRPILKTIHGIGFALDVTDEAGE